MAQSIRSFKTYSVRRNKVTYIGDVYPTRELSRIFPISKQLIIGDNKYYELRNFDNKTVYITDSEGFELVYGDDISQTELVNTYTLFPTVARFKEALYVINIFSSAFPIFTLQTRGRGDNEITYIEYRNQNKEVVFVTEYNDTVN